RLTADGDRLFRRPCPSGGEQDEDDRQRRPQGVHCPSPSVSRKSGLVKASARSPPSPRLPSIRSSKVGFCEASSPGTIGKSGRDPPGVPRTMATIHVSV